MKKLIQLFLLLGFFGLITDLNAIELSSAFTKYTKQACDTEAPDLATLLNCHEIFFRNQNITADSLKQDHAIASKIHYLEFANVPNASRALISFSLKYPTLTFNNVTILSLNAIGDIDESLLAAIPNIFPRLTMIDIKGSKIDHKLYQTERNKLYQNYGILLLDPRRC